MFFLVLVYVFNFDLFEYSPPFLEKGLLQTKEVIWCLGEKIKTSSNKLSNHWHEYLAYNYCLNNETSGKRARCTVYIQKRIIVGIFEENANNVIAKKSVTSPTVINVTTAEPLTGEAKSSFASLYIYVKNKSNVS